MKISNIYNRFIQFGQVSTEAERTKMVEMIKEWCFVPIEASRIDQKYLDVINQFIIDTKINELIKVQPNVKVELIKKLFELLETIETKITEQQSDKSLNTVFDKFSKLSESEFVKFANSRNSDYYKTHLTQHYTKKEIDVLGVKNAIIKSKAEEQKRVKIIETRLTKLKASISEIDIKINHFQSTIEKIKEDQKGKLKIVGKIDLKTGKPLPYKNPNQKKLDNYEKEIEQLVEQKALIKKEIITESEKLTSKSSVIEVLQKEFTDNWETQLKLKEITKIIAAIDEVRKKFLAELYAKIEELKKLMQLLEPFLMDGNEFGRLWDLSKGNWQHINFNFLKKYAQLLEQQPEIKKLANLLGRYKRSEAEIEQETFENIEIISNYKIQHAGKSELVGITESDDLNNLLPMEIALFSDTQTESIFFKRFAEKKLQTFKYISKEEDFIKKTVTENRDKAIEKDKGPFIIAVDTSGSMHGEPERLAKIIAFAITKIGIKDKRKVFLISFSTDVETFELTDIHQSLPKLIEFLQMSFRGGTDASEAVKVTIQKMQTEHYEKADLLIISDGVFGNLNQNILNSIKKLKEDGNRFNALMIGNSYNSQSLSFCNNVWQYNNHRDNLENLVALVRLNLGSDKK